MERESDINAYSFAFLVFVAQQFDTLQNAGKDLPIKERKFENLSLQKDTQEGQKALYACRYAGYLMTQSGTNNHDINYDEVRRLVFEGKTPDEVSDEEIVGYRLHAKHIIEDHGFATQPLP